MASNAGESRQSFHQGLNGHLAVPPARLRRKHTCSGGERDRSGLDPPGPDGKNARFPQIERIGSNWSPGIGGVLVVEAEKNLYAPAGKTSRVTSRAAVAAGKLAPRPSGSISAGSMAEGAEGS